jgi:hypothetical protein
MANARNINGGANRREIDTGEKLRQQKRASRPSGSGGGIMSLFCCCTAKPKKPSQ